MKKIGIIIADKDEYAPILKTVGDIAKKYSVLGRTAHTFEIDGKYQVITVLSGIGKVNAAAVAMHFVDIGCDYVFNIGLSGGISNISKNDITTPDKFLEHDFDLTAIGYNLCEKPDQEYIYYASKTLLDSFKSYYPNVKIGTAVTGDSFICDDNVRKALKKDFSAMSCDMETAAIAYVCQFSNVPFLSIRKISDNAGDDAFETYSQVNSAQEVDLADIVFNFIKIL